MDKFQTFSYADPMLDIEENVRQCHSEAINELFDRETKIASYFDPLPNYPQIQLLGNIDNCHLTFEINNSALSYRLSGETLQIYLYNKNNWKNKTLVAEYLHTRAFETNIWAPVSTDTIPAKDELNQTIAPAPMPLPMTTEKLVQFWYKELINHAIQVYLEEIDQWYQTLEKYKRRQAPDSLAS